MFQALAFTQRRKQVSVSNIKSVSYIIFFYQKDYSFEEKIHLSQVLDANIVRRSSVQSDLLLMLWGEVHLKLSMGVYDNFTGSGSSVTEN